MGVRQIISLLIKFRLRFGSIRGNHHTADIGLQGCKVKVDGKIVDGVHVSVGGRGGRDPRAASRILEDLPCDELPEVLERLVRFFPRPARAAGAEE